MLLSEAVYEKCEKCGKRERELSPQLYGCNNCKKPIKRGYLQTTIFFNDNRDAEYREYCSWRCCLSDLKRVKGFYFIDLPYLHAHGTEDAPDIKEFLKLIRVDKRRAK